MQRFFAILILLALPYGLCAQSAADSFLVRPYLQLATQNSIYILWETRSEASTTVEYGEGLLNAQTPNLSQTVTLEGDRHLHEVKLSNLKTATKYLYRVKSVTRTGTVIESPVYTFRTAVGDEDAVFFALIGDSQYNNKTPWAWNKIAKRVWEDRPHFIIHAGDLVDIGTKKSDWTEHFFPNGHIAMSRFPMYTVLGNHEQDAQLYYDYMVNPEPEYYYTFQYGNVQFFMIDTNKDVSEGSEQYDWLEWALAQSTATWKIAVHHHPPYSTEENDHGDTSIGASSYGTAARNLVPLYEAYGVDFCLFGHTHLYERTWPIFEQQVNLQEGVVYINSGGAGGGLEDFDPARSWFTQELQAEHHYCTFAIYDRHLVFKALNHDGHLFDTFQMEKSEEDGKAQGQLQQPPAPHFEVEELVFQESAKASLSALEKSHAIHYTLDGSEPDLQSEKYTAPLTIRTSCTLKAKAYTENGKASRTVSRTFKKMAPLPARKVQGHKPGLRYSYYEGDWSLLPDFSSLTPVREGVAQTVNETEAQPRADHFGLVLEGFADLPATDTYTFYTRSDDGSKLYIDGQLVVDNDGDHGAFWQYGKIILEKGKHEIRIEYFEGSGSQMLRAGLVDPVLGKVPFHPGQLSYE
jgi:predicted phosphodiesterase